jgi:DNA (cytosine-5)-methyltransferase 1
MLDHFRRVVTQGEPDWFLMENVPSVPDLLVEGYTVQRFDLNARECGMRQTRLRHFQYGSREGFVLVPERTKPTGEPQEIGLASEGSRPDRRSWSDFCELFGLPRDFALPGLSIAARYRAVGNGVPVPMARVVARAIREASIRMKDVRLCVCNCGRIVEGRKRAALPACRKRMQRRRDFAIVASR